MIGYPMGGVKLGDAFIKKLVATPAKCRDCGRVCKATTTGLTVNVCSCGGELVTIPPPAPAPST